MAQLTRSALKALWINGFIPQGSDYTDLLDSLMALLDDELGIEVALAQIDTDIEIKTGVATFPIPEDMTFISAFITVTSAPVGSSAIWDINLDGVTVLSQLVTVEDGELSSLDAITQPAFSTNTANKGQQMSIDCDQEGVTPAQNPVLVILYTKGN